jgi:LEA14-like dessication related protein
MKQFRYAGMLMAGIVLAGCASLGHGSFKEPIVTVKDARVTGLGVAGGSLEVVLNVYNPNKYRLDGTRLTYKLMIDSVTFGTGQTSRNFTVSEKDSSEVRLPLQFSYLGVGEAGRQLMQTGTVNYRVLGDLTITTPVGSFTRPYDQTGRFSTIAGISR